jgi:hypothetical protein
MSCVRTNSILKLCVSLALAIAPGFSSHALGQQTSQAPVPIGTVLNGQNASVGLSELSNGTTIFSGDLLKTGDGGQLQVQAGTVQFVLAEDSTARIFRYGGRLSVELERGTIAYTAKGAAEQLAIFAQDIRFVPATTEPAAGQITVVSHCEVTATARKSTIEAKSGKETKTVETDKSYNSRSEIGVDYHDSWKPELPDYPEYPREAGYHRSHTHVACSAGPWKQKPPMMAGSSHFTVLAITAVGIITPVAVIKALESPDKP